VVWRSLLQRREGVKISKGIIGTAVALGLSGSAMYASADVFNPHFTVGELHSTTGANTAGSYAASTMMGAQGYANDLIPVNWQSVITSSCTSFTGSSLWPASCNPTGMFQAVRAWTNNSWVTVQYTDAQQATALNETLTSLQTFGSPAVVPIFGQADHWVAVTQITATNSGGVWTINQVKYFDGGPPGGADSSGNSYTGGVNAYSGSVWRNVYFKVITAINPSCDPNCTSDPYYNQYVIMFEPPTLNHQVSIGAFDRAPGVVPAGMMNAQVAPSLVWNALHAGGIDGDPEIWNAISGGQPGPAFEVHGWYPNGAAWNYMLVPVYDAPGSNTAIGFVQLAADDGSFEGVNVASTPAPFVGMSAASARQLALAQLVRGETLSGGTLTWDPTANVQFGKSPLNPYYEFIAKNGSRMTGVIRVSLASGTVLRN
jgi:hypothetical protein